MGLTDLHPSVLDRIIDLLPQQAVINLALTNFYFYKPCMRKLYRSILIKPTTNMAQDNPRKYSFQDSWFTSVQGLQGSLNQTNNRKLILARLKVLNSSIKINEELASYVERIEVFGQYNQEVEDELVSLLKSTSAIVYIDDDQLRKSIKTKVEFRSIIVDEEKDLLQELDHIELRRLDYQSLQFTNFDKFTRLCIKRQYAQFFEYLKRNNINISPLQINLQSKHGTDLDYLRCVNLGSVKFLQLTIGCENEICRSNCLKQFLDAVLEIVDFEQLVKLCIVIDEANISHAKSEINDVFLFQFINSISGICRNLSYLFFKFNPNPLGLIDDGFEGNYLRKERFYTHLFPEILDKFQGPQINLVLLNFFNVLTSYEQPMNNMMWNGCKCDHCQRYLHEIDDFILFHKYFSEEEKFLKDLNNPIFLSSVVKNFLNRFLFKDFFTLNQYPLQNVSWDLHTNNFSPIPIQCFDTENFKEGDFNEDKEIFYDSQEDPKCKFKNLDLFPQFSACVVHYANDLMNNLIYLNRGNAESLKLEFDDLNDGEIENKLRSLYVNGFVFSFDKETNGTNFFVNLYDNKYLQ